MDMLEFAINMELEGQKYYEGQADIHSGDGLKVVFDMLAVEEAGHAALLESTQQGDLFQRVEPERSGLKGVFNDIAAYQIDIKSNPEQVDVYRIALEKEQQSIALYKKILSENSGDSELFEFLVKQEEEHYEILEEIVKLVSRPKAWVESAEFGIREEY
jgi:rubrerythrin